MNLLIKKIVKKLTKKKIKISIAESCTGGFLAKSFTSISGSSKVFGLGLVTYSNQSKIEILKVPKKLIRKYGAVSEKVCLAMVKNVSKIAKTIVLAILLTFFTIARQTFSLTAPYFLISFFGTLRISILD
tara:strand:+ start:73 stop:462 length:390 start_codon:yes stop_codon:yes gene_type:complete